MKTQLPPPLEQLPTSSAPPPFPPPPAWSSGAGRSWGRRWRLLHMALRKLAAIVSLILMWPSYLSKLHNFFSIIVFSFFDLDFRVYPQLPCSAVWCESCKSDKVDWKVAKLTGKLCWKVVLESLVRKFWDGLDCGCSVCTLSNVILAGLLPTFITTGGNYTRLSHPFLPQGKSLLSNLMIISLSLAQGYTHHLDTNTNRINMVGSLSEFSTSQGAPM